MERFLIIFFFIISFFVNGQVYDFQKINQEQGLPSSVITTLEQDSRNIIWIGTDGGGLVKYDGNSFKIFDESNGLKGAFVTDLVEDINSNLIIATKYNGISVFNGKNFFKTFDIKGNSLKSNTIYSLINSNNGVYCIGDRDIILIKKDYSIERIVFHANVFGEVNSLAYHNNNLFIACSKGLFVLSNKELKRLLPKLFTGYISLSKNNLNEIVIATINGGLYKLKDPKKNTSEYSAIKLIELPKLFNPKHLFISKRGTIWLSGDVKQGLLMYDGERFLSFDNSNGFNGDNVLCFMQDKAKKLYIGTEGFGLFKTGSQLFIDYSNVDFLNSPSIFSVLKNENDLYVGVKKEGIHKFKEGLNGNYILEKSYLNNVGANVIFKNNKNDVIVGTKEGIGKITNNKLITINLNFLSDDKSGVVAIKQDVKNRYFIGGLGGGLFITDENFRLIIKFKKNNDFFANYIYTIDQFDKNKWYIGTNNGLFILTETSQNIFVLSKRLIKDVISNSTIDSYGNYWFVGNDCIFNYGKNGIKKYNKKNGLTSTLIYTLIADKKGNLWSGSNLGVDKIEVNEKGEFISVKNYNYKNGFKGLETNTRTQCIDSDGNLFLGTGIGLVKCIPNYQLENDTAPPVLITSIKLSNNNIDWITNESKNKWINMPESGHEFKTNENQLSFQYNVINTGYKGDYYYSYKLEGLDNDWSNPTLINEISYSNLPSGNYIFKVKLVDLLEKNLNKETSYSFSIKTPFYLTLWFILGGLILSFLIIYFLFKKFSTFNPDFVRNDNQELDEKNKENRIFLLVFAIFSPLAEFFIEMFEVRNTSELIYSIIVGFLCILIYYLSFKSKVIYKQLSNCLVLIFLIYFILCALKLYFLPFELVTFISYTLVLFFSVSIFRSIKHYWIFGLVVLLFTISLFFNSSIDAKTSVIIVYVSLFIGLMNHTRYITSLNKTEKLMFVNNIVNNGNSLVLGTNKFGEVSFCSENIIKILGYNKDEVMGMGFWNLTQDKEFTYSDYSDKYEKDKVYTRKLKCKSGEYKYIQWIDTKYSNDLYVGIGQDVTEQVKIREQYKNMVDNAADIIFEADGFGNFIFINEAMKRTLGFSPDELLGKHFTSLVREDYKYKLFKFYLILDVNKNEFDVLEFPTIGKNGMEYWVSQKVIVIRDDNDHIIQYSAIVRDITELKNLEIQKVERQEKINNYNKIVYQLTTRTNQSSLNINYILKDILVRASVCLNIDRISIWEHHESKLVSLMILNVSNNEFENDEVLSKVDFPLYFNGLLEGNTIIANNVCENEYTRDFCLSPDNDIKSLLDVPIFLSGSISGLLCCEMTNSFRIWDNEDLSFARSLSEIISASMESEKRKIAENAIKESESNFRLLNETIDDVFWLYDLIERKILYISPSSEKILGISPKDFYVIDNYWQNYILDEDKPAIIEAHKILEVEGFYEIEYRINVKDEIRWIHEKSFGIKSENGIYFKSSGICTNITEKKKIEIQLKQLSIVAEKATNGILIADKNGSVIWANQGYLDLFEINLSNLIGNKPRDLFHLNYSGLTDTIEQLNGANFNKELEVLTFAKNKKWVEIINTVIKDDNGEVIQQIEVVTDITEKVKNKNILLQVSYDLEYKNSLQKSIIHSQSFEDLSFKILSIINSKTKNCISVTITKINEKKDYFSGFELINGVFNKVIIPIASTKSGEALLNGEIFIERNLKNSKFLSPSDIENKNRNIVSYFLLPILDEGKLIAAIYIALGHEFDLSETQIKNLESITILLSVAIKQLELKNELMQINKDNIDSLNYAQNIQRTILPDLKKLNKTFEDICLYFKPRDIVSGDFYWAKEVNDLTFIAVADCTGHGVPGAFLTLIGSRILEQIVDIEKETNPSKILMKLDDQIYLSLNSNENDIIRDGMEIALCVIDTKQNKMQFAGAGLGLLYFLNDKEHYVKGQRKSIGDYRDDDFIFKTIDINLTGAECFFMATDGYQDQLGGANYKRYSKKRTINFLKEIAPKSCEQKEELLGIEMDEFIGEFQQTDDITVVSFKLNFHKKTIDFTLAKEKHAKWKVDIENFLKGIGTLTNEEAVSHLHCDLGKWYYKEGKKKYGHLSVMKRFETEHEHLHKLISSILTYKTSGENEKASVLYFEVLKTSDLVVSLLNEAEDLINI